MTRFLHRMLPNLTPPPDCRGCAVEQRRTNAYVAAKLAGKPPVADSSAPFPLAREAADRPPQPPPESHPTYSIKPRPGGVAVAA